MHKKGTMENAVDRLIANRAKNKTTGCLEWKSPFKPGKRIPYPRIRVMGKKVLVHRFAFELVHGPIPEGIEVLHKCDNPRCSEDKHLFLGTQQDNVTDCIAKGRSKHLESKNRGVENPMAKLTPAIAKWIRTVYKPRKFSAQKIAEEIGVTKGAIYSVLRGANWSTL